LHNLIKHVYFIVTRQVIIFFR